MRLADPCRDVHAVGDVRDRHLLDRAVRPQPAPHLARDLAVARAHAVGDPRRPQRELRDAERLPVVVRVRAAARGRASRRRARAPRPAGRSSPRPAAPGYVSLPAGTGVCVVKTVRRRTASNASSRRRPRRAGARSSRQANAAWPSLRCTRPARRPARAARARRRCPAARTGQPHVAVADVQPRGDPAVGEVVLGPVGVEQAAAARGRRRRATPGRRGPAAERHPHGDRLAVVAGHERAGHAVRVRVDPVLVLPAGGVDPLAEVAVAVHAGRRRRAAAPRSEPP